MLARSTAKRIFLDQANTEQYSVSLRCSVETEVPTHKGHIYCAPLTLFTKSKPDRFALVRISSSGNRLRWWQL